MRSGIVATCSALLVVGAFGVFHATALATSSTSNLTASDEMTIEGEAATLRQAYVYIEAANSYHGHRNKALKAVGAACRSLGGPTKGVARHHEDPQFSDGLFTKARGLLLNVLSHAQAKGQSGVISNVETAIQEIETALSGEEDSHQKGKSPGSTSSN